MSNDDGTSSDKVQRVSTLITAATGSVALIYGLGVVGLFWSLYLPYFRNGGVAAAWYAASLPPRSVAVVYGLKSLLWPVLANVVIIVFFVIVTMAVGAPLWSRRKQLLRLRLLWRDLRAILIIFLLFLVAVGTSALFPMIDLLKGTPDVEGILLDFKPLLGTYLSLKPDNRLNTSYFLYEILLVTGSVVGGGLIFTGIASAGTVSGLIQFLRESRRFRWGCLILYLLLFPGAFVLAGGKAPPLPHVVLLQQTAGADLSASELDKVWTHGQGLWNAKNPQMVEGTLLAHTEKYWYLLDREGDDLLIVPEREKELALILTSKDKLSCEDFASSKEAQAVAKHDPRDIYQLDKDHDGQACERTNFNKAPDADDETIVTLEDTPVLIPVLDGSSNLNAAQTLKVTEVSKPPHGTAEIIRESSNAGEIRYDPVLNFHGKDSFTYEVCDDDKPKEKCATAKVAVTVQSDNDAPMASDDTYATEEGKELRVDTERSILSNDKDVEGDDMSASAVRRFEKGLLNLDEDGSFTYKPRSNFHGDDSFTYEVRDGNGGTNTATVRITVKNNDPPTADAGGPYDVYEGASVTISAFGSDPEGEALTYEWDLDGDGFFETSGKTTTYSAASLDGPSSYKIKVRVADPNGESSVAEGTVNVKPSVQPPPLPPAPRMCLVGETISFTGSANGFSRTGGDNGCCCR